MPKKVKAIKAEKYDDYKVEDETEDVNKASQNTFEAIDEQDSDEDDLEDANKTSKHVAANKFMKVFNVFFIVVMVAMLIIAVDVICITKYNVGPLFAIKTKTYKDGGSKEYYGLGYKVIKYSEEEGRKDTQIGFWNMKYTTDPIVIEDVDLAIEFQNTPEKTANKYYKQYILILSTVTEIEYEDNEITLAYTDPDGKYTLEIECDMASHRDKLSNYKVNDKVSVKGTVYKFSVREDADSNSVSLSNCFID